MTDNPTPRYDNETRGIAMMLGASVCFASMGYFIKKLTADFSTMEIIFMRNLITMLIIFGAMVIVRPVSRGGKPFLLLMRGVYGIGAMIAYFYAISVMHLASAATFSKTSPLFTALIAILVMKEKTDWRVWAAIGVGFGGVLFILKPGGEVPPMGYAAGILCGVLAAFAYTTVRGLADYYDARMVVFVFSLVGVAASLVYFGFLWLTGDARYSDWNFLPTGIHLTYFILSGILASAAQFLMSKSYYYGRASLMGSISYTELVFSVFTGYLAGDGMPDLLSFFGMLLVFVSGVLIVQARKK
ncbi:DMT family transporter [Seleniivibrio woodruffii]|uniref:DMT family transporter n=1 Tax=Seleniivibrio woodruffii TaxID=1078050 RepID=UPI0039E2B6F8